MSYGLRVWSPSGGTRVANSSWLYKLHSSHYVTLVPASKSKTLSVPGYNPSNGRWAVVWDQSPGISVTEMQGSIRVSYEPWGESLWIAYVYIMVVRQ